MYKCKNIDCQEKFKHRAQRSRHLLACIHEKPPELYRVTDNVYECVRCFTKIAKIGNLSRHTKLCKGNQGPKSLITCKHEGCDKQFKFNSKMLEHLKSHQKEKYR